MITSGYYNAAMITRQQAKARLKELGWSYRRVAPLLGVRFEHLCLVLNGHRDSLRLLAAIESLPPAPIEGRQDVA